MRIDCPCCGPRDVGEFSYLGDATRVRPDGIETSLEAMTDYVYFRDNPAGAHRELWFHGFGCRAWLVVARDTRSHEIGEVVFARDEARKRSAGNAAS